MPAPAAAAANRYFLPEVMSVLIVPTIANLAAGPTRLEIDAGVDFTGDVAAVSGWKIEGASIATPDAGKRFIGNINGRITAQNSGFTVYGDKTGQDLRQELVRDQETHIVWMDGGDVAASLMDVYKVTVMSVGKLRELENSYRLDFMFSIQDFVEDLAIPA